MQGIYDALLEYQPETEYTRALIKQYTVTSDSGSVQCYVTALEDTAKFEDMIDLRSRTTGEKITFEQAGGGVIVTEDGLTSRKGVYAGGDVVTGAATVISAMGAGKIAAKAIDEYISAKEEE